MADLLRSIFVCSLIGHNYRCLHRRVWGSEPSFSSTTCWQCQRCGDIDEQQWDDL